MQDQQSDTSEDHRCLPSNRGILYHHPTSTTNHRRSQFHRNTLQNYLRWDHHKKKRGNLLHPLSRPSHECRYERARIQHQGYCCHSSLRLDHCNSLLDMEIVIVVVFAALNTILWMHVTLAAIPNGPHQVTYDDLAWLIQLQRAWYFLHYRAASFACRGSRHSLFGCSGGDIFDSSGCFLGCSGRFLGWSGCFLGWSSCLFRGFSQF